MAENIAFLVYVPRMKILDLVIPKSLGIANDFKETDKKLIERDKSDSSIIGSIRYSSNKSMKELAEEFSIKYNGNILEHEYECDVRFPVEQKGFIEKVFNDYFKNIQ